MPRHVKPLAKPRRDPDVVVMRQDDQLLAIWIREIKKRVTYKHKQETPGTSKWGLIPYVGETFVPVSQTFPTRDAAILAAQDLASRASGAARGSDLPTAGRLATESITETRGAEDA